MAGGKDWGEILGDFNKGKVGGDGNFCKPGGQKGEGVQGQGGLEGGGEVSSGTAAGGRRFLRYRRVDG